ncbi:hypothetical protein A2Y99_01790 [Candidatus Gottesmanbacteria bacterium RBG_13_37_7]|uniref:Major facilitator superfamily (MFS) profile domain-containing protein n=1 Tax=Candidatus Gottesmanbacteria bacterium RBG_13_37_7 TaxID=1798369 RepID=A0A1F5YHY8_9BACT|nr:MAG: hypothetical protein A2Y99_01790 [Candidatus Gottesmanbacteria bacterium RBG_13_37_7]
MFWIFLGMTIYSVGSSVLLPVMQAIVSENSSPHEQGGNLGILQSFGSLGRIAGPVVSGYFYEKISPFTSFYLSSAIFFLIFLLGWKKLQVSRNSTII